MQTAGDRIRVTIHLTDAPAAQIVWAETYDRVVDDIFEIQDDITTEVAIALDLKLLTGEGNLIWWKDLPDRKTRELALRGLSYLYLGSKDGNAVARSIYEELNQICPDAPQAAALIAFTHFLDVMRGFSEDPEKSIESATVYAEKAIELGDIDGFGHIVLGSVRLHQRRYEEALDAAFKLRGTYRRAMFLAATSAQLGRADEARRHLADLRARPDLPNDIRTDMIELGYAASMVDRLLEGLRRAEKL